MSNAGWLPSERTLHTLAELMVGRSLNGTAAESIEPFYRGLLQRVADAEPPGRTALLHDELVRGGFASTEIATLEKAILTHSPNGGPPAPKIRILTGEQLLGLEPLTFLLDPILPEGCFATVIGETNKGKTFCAMEMAGRVALTGRPVLYIVAEGQRGISMRYDAWSRFYSGGEHLPNFFFITQPIFPTVDEMMRDLYESMEMVGCTAPALIVFDTLSMCFVGNENDTPDMKYFVDGITALRLKTGACVLVIHHTGWDTTRMGGNRKLQNAVDVEMRVGQDELGTISLSCTKMRDGTPFPPMHFHLQPVEGTESCVLIPTNAVPQPTATLPDDHAAVINALTKAGLGGLTFTELVEQSGITRKPTLSEALKELERGGLIDTLGDAGRLGRKYFLREAVRAVPGFGTGSEPDGTGSVRFLSLNRNRTEPIPTGNEGPEPPSARVLADVDERGNF